MVHPGAIFFIWALTLSSFSIIYSVIECPFVLVLGCLNFYFSCVVIGWWLTIAIEYYVMLVTFLSVFIVYTNQRCTLW